jgi:two-component system, LytTR family, sensor histidine kinase AlgZ
MRAESMASIDQNTQLNFLPDFRNLGVILRILVIVTLMTSVAAALKAYTLRDWLDALTVMTVLVAPVTILSLLALGIAGPALRRLDARAAVALVIAAELGICTLVIQLAYRGPFDVAPGGSARYWLFTTVATAFVLAYFNLRNRALSPAVTEARLQALQARIRPHFLFNSLNAVLSLMRAEPRRAETALEDLADLFRVLMADNRKLIPLSRELEICRQYLALEELRLGPRLKTDWRIGPGVDDALVPPLFLQPLLENAVYHGIEPSAEPGVVTLEVELRNDKLVIVLRNPYRGERRNQSGNRMALANIRERLLLHFDAEAELSTRGENGVFQATISLPYTREER